MEKTNTFRCNVCGHMMMSVPSSRLGREGASCDGCGASVRLRSIMCYLMEELFGENRVLSDMGASRKDIVGIGLSDWDGYAEPLSRIFDYTNTFYHTDPFLDIVSVPDKYIGKHDFIISTDVFEHVPPPVGLAFHGAFNALKPGGLLVLTVPFRRGDVNKEHYPHLHNYRILNHFGEWVMLNSSVDGNVTLHRNLIFHGGPGTTLEMRVFSQAEVVRLLVEVGFVNIKVHSEERPDWGILLQHNDGLPITARRPPAPRSIPMASDAASRGRIPVGKPSR